jgi:hypothetical protein
MLPEVDTFLRAANSVSNIVFFPFFMGGLYFYRACTNARKFNLMSKLMSKSLENR